MSAFRNGQLLQYVSFYFFLSLVVVAPCRVLKAGSSVLQEPSSCLVHSQPCLAIRGAVIMSKRRIRARCYLLFVRMGSAFISD